MLPQDPLRDGVGYSRGDSDPNTPIASPLTQVLESDTAPKFKGIVDDSFAFQATESMIKQRIQQDFHDLQQAVNKFEECRKVHEFHTTIDFNEFAHANYVLLRKEELLENLREWESIVNLYIMAVIQQGFVYVKHRKRLYHWIQVCQRN